MIYSAHSPDKKKSIDFQSYESHVKGVLKKAIKYVEDIGEYAVMDNDALSSIVRQSALFHDLGKLDKANQPILLGEKSAKRLPVNHVDAGASYFLDSNNLSIAATVIQAHHIGYGNFLEEESKEDKMFRDSEIMEHTDKTLDDLLTIHNSLINESNVSGLNGIKGNKAVFLRIALSCLVDADHTDTSVHYQDHTEPPPYIRLRAKERLAKLDRHVKTLNKGDDERSNLRNEMYYSSKDSKTNTIIVSCDSPVGSGKTTAIMAHLLNQAINRQLRRIFVILPFTNIIQQSVKIYRDALVLEGENSDEVVAELHHRADFQDKESRFLTSLWRAPIVVTTAVAFFETLASNSPSSLRRLHELPGSAIFVDESHAALPVKLLPLTLEWINTYSQEWNCYWVLASGSLCRFWDIEEIRLKNCYSVSELINTDLRKQLLKYEKNRVKYQHDLTPKGLQELSEWVIKFPGPRLVIVNTVQNAAIIADYFEKNFGKKKVKHLSTALTPNDRENVIKAIEERLKDKADDDWTLISTSCVEAGVNISFRTGFRELCSLLSLLQTAGRINREGLYCDSEMWTFKLKESDCFNINSELHESRNILQKYFERRIEIVPELSTESIKEEIQVSGVSRKSKDLVDHENTCGFRFVEDLFRVIDTKTVIVIVNDEIINKIKNHEKISWQDVQKHSVRLYGHNVGRFVVEELIPGIYEWGLEYNDFLGYMAGALTVVKAEKGVSLIA